MAKEKWPCKFGYEIIGHGKNIPIFFMDFILEEKCAWFGIEI